MRKNEIIKLLEANDIKPTIQRIIILDYLMSTKEHPTAEMIYNQIKKDFPTLSLATVYNTLEIFEKNGLIRSIKFQHDNCRYDFVEQDHLHLYFSDRNEIIDLYDKQLIKIIENRLKKHKFQNFKLENINIEIKQLGEKQ